MNRIPIDEVLREKLLGLDKYVEVVDAQGHVIGRFLPVAHPALHVGRDCPFSPEELARRKHDTRKRYTTEEIIERLQDRGRSQ